MKIGIIGAGHIGGTLTRRLKALGDLVKETGARATTVADAARDKDVVIVTIPEKRVPDLRKELGGAIAPNTVVVDTGNYYPKRDGKIADIEAGVPESQWVADQLGRPVVKAFNTIYAHRLLEGGKPSGERDRIALPVAGDDTKAKQVVMKLVDELGFDGVDAGGLADSWRQQPGTPIYGTDLDADRAKRALAEANSERKPEFRG